MIATKESNYLQIFRPNMFQTRKKNTRWCSLLMANVSTYHFLFPHIPELLIKKTCSQISFNIISLGWLQRVLINKRCLQKETWNVGCNLQSKKGKSPLHLVNMWYLTTGITLQSTTCKGETSCATDALLTKVWCQDIEIWLIVFGFFFAFQPFTL